MLRARARRNSPRKGLAFYDKPLGAFKRRALSNAARRFPNTFPAVPKKYSFFSCIGWAKEYFTRIIILLPD
jgi:hypothetical protein